MNTAKKNGFTIGINDREDFGTFSFSKDTDIDEMCKQFKRELLASREGRKARDKALNERKDRFSIHIGPEKIGVEIVGKFEKSEDLDAVFARARKCAEETLVAQGRIQAI